jgi:hypothetical protein
MIYIIEDKASSPSYDLAPAPSLPPPSPVSKRDRQHTGRLRKRQLADGRERGGGGGGAKSHRSEKAWSSINHSILFGYKCIVSIKLIYRVLGTSVTFP